MSQFSISGRIICGQRAAIPSEPFKRQGDLSHTRHPRMIDTLRQSRNHPPQQRKEGDLIVGSASGSAIAALVERSTRFVILLHLPGDHSADTVAAAVIREMGKLPEHLRRSVTWDRGTELAEYAQIQTALDLTLSFATRTHPGSAAATRTPTVSCGSGSRRAPTSRPTPPTTSNASPRS